MLPSVRAFLAGILDYAGLFPPAQLPLDQAIRNYARYRQELESWMLGRFICPASRLTELAPFHEHFFQSGPPLVISALGRGGKDIDEFLRGLQADLEAIEAFESRQPPPFPSPWEGEGRGGGRAVVDMYEVRLPADLDPSKLEGYLELFAGYWAVIGPRPLMPFYEPALDQHWRTRITTLCRALDFSIGKTKGNRFERKGGLKLRCGGVEAAAFPSPEQVAHTIVTCRDFGIPFKATAGLHHPVRHYDASLRTPVHGFLNLFGAGILADVKNLTIEQVQQIIEDEDSASFRFDEAGFRWKDWQAPTSEIVLARQYAYLSFGSCSFDEPRDDLRALGLLD